MQMISVVDLLAEDQHKYISNFKENQIQNQVWLSLRKKMVGNSPTEILKWKDAEPIFKFYISLWQNHISLNWANLAWHALHEGGLTVFNSDDEEVRIRSYAVALSLIYYEYCHRIAFHEYKDFRSWNKSIIKEFKREFLPDLEKDKDLISRVVDCLTNQFSEDKLCSELWINCAESHQGFIFSNVEKSNIQNKLLHPLNNDFNYRQGEKFILGDEIDDISNYVSISGL